MTLTEDEAKTKRCCGPDGCGAPVFHVNSGEFLGRFCIGSACMAWQWRGNLEPTLGFCGLAGKP
jgi:hypothetical protein